MSVIHMGLVQYLVLDWNTSSKKEDRLFFFFFKPSRQQKSTSSPDDYYPQLIIFTEKNVWGFFFNLKSYSFSHQSSVLLISFPTGPRSPLAPTKISGKEIRSLINSPLYLSDKLTRSCTFSCSRWASFYPFITLSSHSLLKVHRGL